MIAKIRNLTFSPAFPQEYTTNFKNLLVSGCSYVWNNSEEHVCTWPYVLKDIVGFDQIYDCSQSGGGPSHVFNSIINEIETNDAITPENTLVIIMWPELSRVDTISRKEITQPWHHMSNYNFNDKLATLSLPATTDGNTSLDQLSRDYAKHVDGTVYENLIKVKALDSYLRDKNFTKIFLSWKTPLSKELTSYLNPVEYLDSYTALNKMRIPNDGHPTPEAHLQWTRNCLIPFLLTQNLVVNT